MDNNDIFNATEKHFNFFNNNGTEESMWLFVTRTVRNLAIPLIGAIGLIGNTLCLLVFSARSMKMSSCSVFLASLALVDNLFLIAMLLTWIDGQIKWVFINSFMCQLVVFLTYVSSFLSVWFIVGFTCERFIAISFPLRSAYLCSVFREKVVVVFATFFAIGLYNFSFWTTKLEEIDEEKICLHRMEFLSFLHVVTWLDTILTMIVPFLLIVIMNMMVLRAVLRCPVVMKAKVQTKIFSKVSSTTMLLRDNSVEVTAVKNGRKRSRMFHRKTPQTRVTRSLLIVSFTFLFLNLPSHVIRIYNLIISVTSENHVVSEQFYLLQELSLILYYATFSCNFFLYTFFCRNFKRALCCLLRCKSAVDLQRKQVLYRLNSTQATQRSCDTAV